MTTSPLTPDPKRPPALPGAGTFALYLLLVSLGMLFAASIVAYLVIRSHHQPWPPPGFPLLPRSLWLSTAAILAASVTIQYALTGIRRGNQVALQHGLTLTTLLGLAFLLLQALAWWQVLRQINSPAERLGPYLNIFYILTALHAAHVLAGLIPLTLVTRHAYHHAYSPTSHPGVRYCAIYWHFLDAVWCVLFTVVYLL